MVDPEKGKWTWEMNQQQAGLMFTHDPAHGYTVQTQDTFNVTFPSTLWMLALCLPLPLALSLHGCLSILT